MTPLRLSSRVIARSNRERRSVQGAAPPAPGTAFPVPWEVVGRSPLGVIEVLHRGAAPLRAVRMSLAGDGLLGLTLPRTVHPGERLRVVLRGTDGGSSLPPEAMLVLRWFEPGGTELLWPIAL